MAVIIRGADTGDHSLASQSLGLQSFSAGLAYNVNDDQKLLEKGMLIYDVLYSWAKYLQKQKHTQSPSEKSLLAVFNRYLDKQNPKTSKLPNGQKSAKKLSRTR